MDIQIYKNQLQETVIAPMIRFLTEYDDCGFTQKHVANCEVLILDYLTALEKIAKPTNEEIMTHVNTLVLALNELNQKADYCLLETEEREAIWEIIQTSAVACGLVDPEDDITEEWREW